MESIHTFSASKMRFFKALKDIFPMEVMRSKWLADEICKFFVNDAILMFVEGRDKICSACNDVRAWALPSSFKALNLVLATSGVIEKISRPDLFFILKESAFIKRSVSKSVKKDILKSGNFS